MWSSIWFTYLYQPLFNALIYIYNTIAQQNLGWAVIWLTIFLRLGLLPLSIITERNGVRQKQIEEEAKKTVAAFKNDAIVQKQEFRKIMRKHHISPWAKVLTLLVQAVVFVLLYQVFVNGINGEKVLRTLYQFVDFPGKINTVFYGFEIGRVHDVLWAGIAAGYLLISIFVEKMGAGWRKSEMFFLIFFPLFTFVILWYLPMVKSLFILTTMVFSDIISLLGGAFFNKKKEAHKAH